MWTGRSWTRTGPLRPRTAGGGGPRGAGRHPAGPLHGPPLSARPADRPSSSGSTPRWFATRGHHQGSHEPPHALAGRLRRARSPPTCSICFAGHDQPAVVFTDRGPDEPDFIIAAFPTGREHFDDYVGQNREHAEIDALGGRYAAAMVAIARSPAATRCFTSAPSAPASEMLAFRASRPRATGRPRSDLRAAQSALSRDDVRDLAP